MNDEANPFENLGDKETPETNSPPKRGVPALSADELARIKALASEGKGVNEVARILGRSPATVSRCFRKLRLSGAVALNKAGALVQEKIDAAQQLKKINERINQIIDEYSQKDAEKGKWDPELVIKAAAEIRGQLKLQLEIFQALYNVEEVAKWQAEILDILGEVAPDARDRFYQRLQQRRAV